MPGFDGSWGEVIFDALMGGAKGAMADDEYGAFVAGGNVGLESNQRRRNRAIQDEQRGMARQNMSMRQDALNLDREAFEFRRDQSKIEYDFLREKFDAQQNQFGANNFNNSLSTLLRFRKASESRYLNEFISAAPYLNKGNEGALYPTDDKRAVLMNKQSGLGRGIGNVDGWLFAALQAEENGNEGGRKQAATMRDLLGLELGIDIIEKDGKKFLYSKDIGWLPYDLKSGAVIKEKLTEKYRAINAEIIELNQMRNNSIKSTQKFMLNKQIANGVNPEIALALSKEYTAEVSQKPHLQSGLKLALSIDRFSSEKDPEYKAFEQEEALKLFKQMGVDIVEKNGVPYIDVSTINTALSRLMPDGEKVDIVKSVLPLPSSLGSPYILPDPGDTGRSTLYKIDATLAKRIRDGIGVGVIANRYEKEGIEIQKQFRSQRAAQYEAKFAGEVRDANLAEQVKVRSENRKSELAGTTHKGRTFAQHMDNANLTVDERDQVMEELVREQARTVSKLNMAKLDKKYQSIFGEDRSLLADLANAYVGLDDILPGARTRSKQATKFFEENKPKSVWSKKSPGERRRVEIGVLNKFLRKRANQPKKPKKPKKPPVFNKKINSEFIDSILNGVQK